jgi:hypothetical protein
MYYITLSGARVKVPAKAGEPEYVWRYWRQAESNLEVWELAQGLGATPLQNLEAYLDDFQYFWKPVGQIVSPGDDASKYHNSVSWEKIGNNFSLKVASQWGVYFFFIFYPETARLRVERSRDPKFKGKTVVTWFNL